MTANLTVQNTGPLCTAAEWASPEGTSIHENSVFLVSIGSKFPQISFGRDPVVLVLLILFPTPSHDYQLMCTRTKINILQFIPSLITVYPLNLQLLLANILPLLPFPFTTSLMLSHLDTLSEISISLIVSLLTSILLSS